MTRSRLDRTVLNRVLLLAVTLVFVMSVTIAVSRQRLERATTRRVEALLSMAERPDIEPITREDYTECPAPVRRYFEAVIENGRPPVQTVRTEQRGEFRLGGRSGSWKPMRATQHYSVAPPGFIWDADIEISPGISARVVDAYEMGNGSLAAWALSTVRVAQADPGPEMNESELLRYLGEAVWFPTALLPRWGVEWTAVDEHAARATIDDRGASASLVFHFNEDALVERVTAADRYRQESDDTAPWTGHFEDYEWRDGLKIPRTASVEWALLDGELPYWRARIETIEYDLSPGMVDRE